MFRSQTEIGWFEVEMTPAARDDPVLGGVPERFMALQWHDYACDPGAGTNTLAEKACATRPFVSAKSRGAPSFTSR